MFKKKCKNILEVEIHVLSPPLVAFTTVTSYRCRKIRVVAQNMAESPTNSLSFITTQIPIEIISEEEMGLIEAAMAMASRSIIPFNQFARNVRSVDSISLLAKRRLSSCNGSELESLGDIEDSAATESSQNKRNKVRESFLNRFRRKRGLGVTDVTGAVLFKSFLV